MSSRPFHFALAGFALLCLAATELRAQSGRLPPKQQPATAEQDEKEKVYTEEVRIPVFARDEYGRFDPTLAPEDILVLEDGVPQVVRSVRRIPASVLLLLSAGGELNPAQRTNTTREAALNLVGALRAGDQVAVMQFDRKLELLQNWTADEKAVVRVLRTKLHSGTGARPSEALVEAAKLFAEQPVGNRHIVLVADGVATPGGGLSPKELERALRDADAVALGGRAGFDESARALQSAQVTLHVISYTALARVQNKRSDKAVPTATVPGSVAASGIRTVGIDPTLPPGTSRGGVAGPTVGAVINFDPQMRRLRKAYERAMKRSEERLKTLTTEMGGRLWLPETSDDVAAQAAEVAREIGTQYVITYAPKRPLAGSPAAEYRRLTVNPRRNGLQLRARRGYVAAAMQTDAGPAK